MQKTTKIAPFWYPWALALMLGFMPATALPTSTPGVDVEACQKAYRKLVIARGKNPISESADTFMLDHFLPVVGQRGVGFAVTRDSKGLTWQGYASGRAYRVEFTGTGTKPLLKDTDTARTLVLPETTPFKNLTPGNIKHWLLGHPLHPFIVDPQARVERISLNEPSLFHRQVQIDAQEVGKTYLDQFHKTQNPEFQRFLYVAPTGTGKSEIYLGLLATRLDQIRKSPGLVIVASERANVVRDRFDEARELQKKRGEDFELVHWGGTTPENQGIRTLDELAEKVRTSPKPVVLVATSASLRSAMGTNAELAANTENIKGILKAVFVDEAHHLGATMNSQIVGGLLDKNAHATLTGFTATPINSIQSIQKLFNDHGFWAYIDDPKDFIEHPTPINRDVADIAQQLRIAFTEGELVGFESIHYIPMVEQSGVDSIYVKRDATNLNSRLVIDPRHYPKLLAKLSPILLSGRGIIVANDVLEAKKLSALINQLFKNQNRKSEVITSDLAPAGSAQEAKILDRFKKGITQILISVMKLDEGINLHDANFYIELDSDPSAKLFLQRAGRTTRVSPKKTETKVYMLSEYTETQLREKLKESFKDPSSQDSQETKTKIGPDHAETVDLDMIEFLRELEKNNIDRVNFWTTNRYSLSEEELEKFQLDVVTKAAELFPGWTTKTNAYFMSLAEKLPLENQPAYLDELQELNISPQAFAAGRTKLRSADSVHRGFLLYAKHMNHPVNGRITLENLIAWGLATGQRYSISDTELKKFQLDVVTKASELFLGWATKTNAYFISLAEKLPLENQAAYLDKLQELNISPQAFAAGRRQLGSTDSVHRGFLLYAKHMNHPVNGRITLENLIAWGLATRQRYSISETELKKFQLNVATKAAELFPGWITKTNAYFISLAEKLPLENQVTYLDELQNLNISPQAFNAGRTKLRSVDSVHRGFLLYAKHMNHPVNGRITKENLRAWGLTTGQKHSISETELKKFQIDVVNKAAELFPGWTRKANAYFISLAEKLPLENQVTYLDELQILSISPVAFNAGRTKLRSADSIHRGFLLYAKHMNHPVNGRITKENLRAWGLTTGQKYSISETELKEFQIDVVNKAAELFPGWTRKANAYFISLAEKLPLENQVTYLDELQKLNISPTAFKKSGRTLLGSADSVHRGFLLYAKFAGQPLSPQITLHDLRRMGLIK